MVKIERSFPAPASLVKEAKKANGRYDKQDVIEQLKKDFHNKCYICEIKELQDPNVEHLLPHKNGIYIYQENSIGKIFSGPVDIVMELRITRNMMKESSIAVNMTQKNTCIFQFKIMLY